MHLVLTRRYFARGVLSNTLCVLFSSCALVDALFVIPVVGRAVHLG